MAAASPEFSWANAMPWVSKPAANAPAKRTRKLIIRMPNSTPATKPAAVDLYTHRQKTGPATMGISQAS